MTAPPEARLRADPLNITARKFSRKRSGAPAQPECAADEDTEAKAAFIQEYNDQHRSHSLAELHRQQRGRAAGGDRDRGRGHKDRAPAADPARGEQGTARTPFNWERDMQASVNRPSSKTLQSLDGRFGQLQDRFAAGSGKKRFL